MSSNMGQIESEHLELFALEFGKIAESDFVYTVASTNIDQSAPNLVKMYIAIKSSVLNLVTIYIPIKSQMSSIIGQIESEHPELFALEFRKIADSEFVYTPAYLEILTNQHQT